MIAWRIVIGLFVAVLIAGPAEARIGLVTGPKRSAVQLTIYNSADLTLVREQRRLTMAKGQNCLEFSWSGTLIDRTSVEFIFREHADQIEVIDVSFPAASPNAMIWNIESEYEGDVLVEISYFTAGITWSADYSGILNEEKTKMNLESYVKVSNHSGEQFDNAQVRLIVGEINLVEEISEIARRDQDRFKDVRGTKLVYKARAVMSKAAFALPMPTSNVVGGGMYVMDSTNELPEIIQEGLSEYFIYTVSGEHEVPNNWSVRWLNFASEELPIRNFFKYEEGRYNQPRRFVKLYNREEDGLGKIPLPDGDIYIYGNEQGRKKFIGSSYTKYVPVGEKWEIDVGVDPDVTVQATKKDFRVNHVEFTNHGEPLRWRVEEDWTLSLLNSTADPIDIQIERNFHAKPGDLEFEKIAKSERYDYDSLRFKRSLGARSRNEIDYTVRYLNSGRRS